MWGELVSRKRLFNPPPQFSRLGTWSPALLFSIIIIFHYFLYYTMTMSHKTAQCIMLFRVTLSCDVFVIILQFALWRWRWVFISFYSLLVLTGMLYKIILYMCSSCVDEHVYIRCLCMWCWCVMCVHYEQHWTIASSPPQAIQQYVTLRSVLLAVTYFSNFKK